MYQMHLLTGTLKYFLYQTHLNVRGWNFFQRFSKTLSPRLPMQRLYFMLLDESQPENTNCYQHIDLNESFIFLQHFRLTNLCFLTHLQLRTDHDRIRTNC